MIFSSHAKISKLTSSDFAKMTRAKRIKYALGTAVLSAAFAELYLYTEGNVIAPITIIAIVALLTVVIQYPRCIFFIMLGGAIVVETFPLGFADSFTDRIPLWWDVNSVVQFYLHKNDFHAMPASVFEVLLFLSGLSWLIRSIYLDRMKFITGPLFVPILLYVLCVAFGLMHGLTSGGLFNIALFEIRAQFYFLLAYLLCVNTAKSPDKTINLMLWMTALCVGFKGILGTIRYLVTLKGVTIAEIGIGSHEESFFFDCFFCELMVLYLAQVQPKLRITMLCLLPFVIIANLANERRAATAALSIVTVAMLALSAVAFPNRRKFVTVTALSIVGIMAVYLPTYWNSSAAIAQPARAIKSQFTPDPRDASSNLYRDQENVNLLYTMRTSPIIGYGYGKPFIENVSMIDLTAQDPFVHYMTHNQILWVWMRVGTVGFFCFWIMVSSIIIKACQLLRNPRATVYYKTAALLCVLITAMQMIFGLLDLQISNVRNMLYCGTWAGVIAYISILCPPPEPKTKNLNCNYPSSYVRWNVPGVENKPV